MASPNSSPKGSPKPSGSNAPLIEEMDTSLVAWLTNTHDVLKWPGTILTVAILLVAGAFAEIAPRKSLEIFNNIFDETRNLIYQSAMSQLAAKGYVECAWDEEQDKMVFWVDSEKE